MCAAYFLCTNQSILFSFCASCFFSVCFSSFVIKPTWATWDYVINLYTHLLWILLKKKAKNLQKRTWMGWEKKRWSDSMCVCVCVCENESIHSILFAGRCWCGVEMSFHCLSLIFTDKVLSSIIIIIIISWTEQCGSRNMCVSMCGLPLLLLLNTFLLMLLLLLLLLLSLLMWWRRQLWKRKVITNSSTSFRLRRQRTNHDTMTCFREKWKQSAEKSDFEIKKNNNNLLSKNRTINSASKIWKGETEVLDDRKKEMENRKKTFHQSNSKCSFVQNFCRFFHFFFLNLTSCS